MISVDNKFKRTKEAVQKIQEESQKILNKTSHEIDTMSKNWMVFNKAFEQVKNDAISMNKEEINKKTKSELDKLLGLEVEEIDDSDDMNDLVSAFKKKLQLFNKK